MNSKKYLSDSGLTHFLTKINEVFCPKTRLEQSRNILDTYILNIKYTDIEDDTSTAILGVGKLGIMVLGK